MKTYDLYGYDFDDDIYSARDFIAKTIGVQFRMHESSHRAGMYFRGGNDFAEHFILQRNFDDFENEWIFPEYQAYPLILLVEATTRSAELEKPLTSTKRLKLLKHREFELRIPPADWVLPTPPIPGKNGGGVK